MQVRRMQLISRETIRQRIDTLEISERQIARSSGLSHATVNHLVSGRRSTCSVATAQAISAALELSLAALFAPAR